ncbi:MAG: CinA family protein [Rhodothalassiaceae bacterium]
MIFPAAIEKKAADLLAHCRSASLLITTAESCTGGLVAGALTGIAGASDVFERGFVTYSNRSKSEVLAVPGALIVREGAVSEAVARAMAAGALAHSAADLALAVTGIAGPGGGTAGKPVGLVWFAIARRDQGLRTLERRFGNPGRTTVRLKAVATALDLLSEAIVG